MTSDLHPVVVIALVAGFVALISLPFAVALKVPLKPSWRGATLASLPSLGMLVLFYSLAIHMYQTLGSWPTSIGETGFPGHLVVHVFITVNYCIAIVLLTVFGGPILLIAALARQAWRPLVRYLYLHALFFVGCWLLMQLAAPQFLYWWRD